MTAVYKVLRIKRGMAGKTGEKKILNRSVNPLFCEATLLFASIGMNEPN